MLTFREPDTPVTQLNTPNGNFTLIFFKLFSVAPCTSITFVFRCFLLFLGTSIFFLPLTFICTYHFGLSDCVFNRQVCYFIFLMIIPIITRL